MAHRYSVVFALLAGCGGTSTPASPAPATRTAADLGPMCHRHYARQATCVDAYLSAQLDLRVELDMPPGIGAEVKANGRDAMLERAHTEWQRDMEPAKIDAICDAMATRTPPDQVDPLLAEGDKCEATADCEAFAACAVATERSYIESGAQH